MFFYILNIVVSRLFRYKKLTYTHKLTYTYIMGGIHFLQISFIYFKKYYYFDTIFVVFSQLYFINHQQRIHLA